MAMPKKKEVTKAKTVTKGEGGGSNTSMGALRAWVPTTVKIQFEAKAKEMEHSASSLLALMVRQVLGGEPFDESNPRASETKDGKLDVRLNRAMKAALRKRAAGEGMKPSSYVHALIRAHLSKTPVLSDRELGALNDANNQLTAIGRNINQIARALNTSLDNAHQAQAIDLEMIRQYVNQQREMVRALIRTNMRAWGIDDGAENF